MGPFDFPTWIPRNAVTQILGAHQSGKTTLLRALGYGWKGEGVAVLFNRWGKAPKPIALGTNLFQLDVPSLEGVEKIVQVLHEKKYKGGLVLIDDVPGWKSTSTGFLSVAQAWGRIFSLLKRTGCTVVVTSPPPVPKNRIRALEAASDVIYRLHTVVTTPEGVVVETLCSKNKRGPTTVGARLWIRPNLPTPVQPT